jgi:hypothetical protein
MRVSPLSRTRLLAAAVAAGLTVAATACHTDPYATGAAGQPDSGSEGDLLVVGPADGDTVKAPFEVAVTAGVELGAVAEGLHHIHIWFGEKQEETLTEHFTDAALVKGAPEGEATMWVQLADAEHALVGEPISLALTIEPADKDPEGGDQEGGDQEGGDQEGGDQEGGDPEGGEGTGSDDGYDY